MVEPTPQIVCGPDGHFAVCPACGESVDVPVADVPYIHPATGVQHGHTTDYDLSVFAAHWQETHS